MMKENKEKQNDTPTAGIIGWFGDGPKYAGGESDKIKSLKTLCEHVYSRIEMVTTDGWKRNPLRLIHQIRRLLATCDDVFIGLSTGGTLKLLPIINWLNRHKKRHLFYAMIGIGTFKFESGIPHPTMEQLTSFVQNPKLWKKGNARVAKNLEKMDAVFVETQTLKSMCEVIYGLKNVVYLTNFRSSAGALQNIVTHDYNYPIKFVYFARLCEDKGADDLLAACSLMDPNMKSKCSFDFYGMVQPFAQEWFHKLVWPDNCHYRGVVLQDKIAILSNYDCMVFPSRYIEGVPGTVIDCRYSSLPLVCSNFTFASDLVDNATDGFIYPYKDVDSLLAILKSIIQDPTSLRSLSTNSRKRAVEFGEATVLPIFRNAIKR